VPFQQTCSPACYWGGLCNANHCIKQRNSCIIFCPDGFTCSYGYCVKNELLQIFLQELLPYLYTDNALVQPSNPDTHPVYDDGTGTGPGGSTGPFNDGGVGGQLGTDAPTTSTTGDVGVHTSGATTAVVLIERSLWTALACSTLALALILRAG
jgi:hypothetical protein